MTAQHHPDLNDLKVRYLAAQLRGDRRGALRVVMSNGFDQGVSIKDLYEAVVVKAQSEIGILWRRNELGIAQEHMATEISNLVLAQLYEWSEPAPRNGRRVYVACVEGEMHALPARIVADTLDTAGFDIRYLGANTPTQSLLTMIDSSPPDLIALSATMSFHAIPLRDAITQIHGRFPQIPIAIGGGACLWATTLTMPFGVPILTAPTATTFVEVAKAHFGLRGDPS